MIILLISIEQKNNTFRVVAEIAKPLDSLTPKRLDSSTQRPIFGLARFVVLIYGLRSRTQLNHIEPYFEQ